MATRAGCTCLLLYLPPRSPRFRPVCLWPSSFNKDVHRVLVPCLLCRWAEPKKKPIMTSGEIRHSMRIVSSTLHTCKQHRCRCSSSRMFFRHKGNDNIGKDVIQPTSQAEYDHRTFSKSRYMHVFNQRHSDAPPLRPTTASLSQ